MAIAGSFEDLVLISKAFNPLSIHSLNLEHLPSKKREREACKQHKGRGFQGAQPAEWGWGRCVSGWDLYSLPSERAMVKFRC